PPGVNRLLKVNLAAQAGAGKYRRPLRLTNKALMHGCGEGSFCRYHDAMQWESSRVAIPTGSRRGGCDNLSRGRIRDDRRLAVLLHLGNTCGHPLAPSCMEARPNLELKRK